MSFLIIVLVSFFVSQAQSKIITTNEVVMLDAPEWLSESRVDGITFRIQQKLEWSTRRTQVKWYKSRSSFERAHTLGPHAMAVTVGRGNIATVHLGPLVEDSNFDQTFSHELVHVIVIQKYKQSIPKWLEEGLANHYSNRGKVDYQKLLRSPYLGDFSKLAHPLMGSFDEIGIRYLASQAFAEMLDKKCGLENLIRLSVQRKMEDYIKTYCEIPDLNKAFRDWLKFKSNV